MKFGLLLSELVLSLKILATGGIHAASILPPSKNYRRSWKKQSFPYWECIGLEVRMWLAASVEWELTLGMTRNLSPETPITNSAIMKIKTYPTWEKKY